MKTTILLILEFFISSLTFAQYPGWENITNTNNVFSIYNDADTLWIGTYGGLVKYNKRTDESYCYNKANAGLPTNCINDLGKDSKNNLWIAGQYNGIGCFNNGKCKKFSNGSTSIVSNEYCNGIYIDKNDTVFLGGSFKFYRIFDNQNKSINAGNPVMSSPQYIHKIVAAPDSSLVAATTYGLYNYKDGAFTLMNSLKADCNVVRYDNSGNLWVGTNLKGLYKYDSNNTLTIYNASNSVCPNNITDCFVDKNNNVWIAGGLKLINFKESGISDIYNLNITNDQISTLSYDETCVWVGTYQNGLYRFKNGIFNKVGIYNTGLLYNSGGPLEVIGSFLLIKNWGITKFDGKNVTVLLDTLSGLKTNPFRGMKVCKDKGIFTYGDKTTLGYFENNTWRYYDQFTTDYIKNIASISADTFWVSTTNRGLLKYENGQVYEFNSTNSPLPDKNLLALTYDKKNVLWGSFVYATGTPGIFSFDGTNWHIWTNAEVPYLIYPAFVLKFDSQNNLWCNSINNGDMTSCKGLIRYDGTRWTNYDTSNSLLPSNAIYNIFIDSTDTVWTAGVEGAAKFDRNNKWEEYTMGNSGLAFINVQDVARLPNGDVYFTHSYGGLSVLKNSGSINDISPILLYSSELEVYPVPAQNILNIEIPVNCMDYKIEMYDLTAKLIYCTAWNLSVQTTNLKSINTSTFPKGIYFLQLKTDKKNYLKKVIIR